VHISCAAAHAQRMAAPMKEEEVRLPRLLRCARIEHQGGRRSVAVGVLDRQPTKGSIRSR
jgi:hypothetical protein